MDGSHEACEDPAPNAEGKPSHAQVHDYALVIRHFISAPTSVNNTAKFHTDRHMADTINHIAGRGMSFVRSRYGDFKLIDTDSVISESLRLYGEWAQNEIDLLGYFIQPGAVVVDAGAFIGTHTRAFSALVGLSGKILSFEPRHEAYSVLVENANFASADNILALNMALGIADASVTVPPLPLAGTFNFGAANLESTGSHNGAGELINITSLDTFELDHLDFIKIDVEGMEIAVLNGAKETVGRCRPVIFAECNSLEASMPILKWAQEKHYQGYGVLSAAYNHHNFAGNAENIFGAAQETGLLLIPAEKCIQHEAVLSGKQLPQIKTADSLALLLLHKPQYPYEILSDFASTGLGLDYPSPRSEELSHVLIERDNQISGLQKSLSDLNDWLNAMEAKRNHYVTGDSTVAESSLVSPHQATLASAPTRPVQVIVPVYRGPEETTSCLKHLLDSRTANRTPFEVVIIDDCSPEPEITSWLREHAENSGFKVLHNEKNIGFVRTVNRGMQLSNTHDIVLLNSDTIADGDWLDRLQRCAYHEATIGTVTPFSNNAEICSYPKFCVNNALPEGENVQSLHSIFAHVNDGSSVDIPTGVGFCMYIKRDLLRAIGLFDAKTFGRGYGEENDFCRRAAEKGWRNVLACDAFVAHVGAVSFEQTSNPAKERAAELVDNLHPTYHRIVHKFIEEDPVRPFRQRVDVARLRASPLPVILFLSHNRGGGTQKHINELAELLAPRASCLAIQPLEGDIVTLRWLRKGEAFLIQLNIAEDYEKLVTLLHTIGIARIHVHHTMGLPTRLWELPSDLGVPFDFTAHDYYAACPQISLTRDDDRYCGERGVADCRTCLRKNPAPGGVNIEVWRGNNASLLNQAERVIAPSLDVAKRIHRYFPDARIVHLPHPERSNLASPSSLPQYVNGGVLKVAVLGALGKIKGADLLEECAVDAKNRNLPIKFQLIGYSYRSLRTFPKANLAAHGPYNEGELPELLGYYGADLIWFPALCPESYSYTLSSALAAGAPILAPNLGAFAERLVGRGNAWIYKWDERPEQINDLLLSLWRGEPQGRDLHSPEKVAPIGETDNLLQADEFICRYVEPLNTVLGRNHDMPSDDQLAFLAELARQNTRAKSVRHGLAEALYVLRSSWMLRPLAKAIPAHFQRRVKNRLLRL